MEEKLFDFAFKKVKEKIQILEKNFDKTMKYHVKDESKKK